MTDIRDTGKAILLYDVMKKGEDYEGSMERAVGIVRHAMKQFPGKQRIFVLDIDDHRNSAGGWDRDSLDYQHAILNILGPWLSEIQVPLIHVKARKPQREDEMPPVVLMDADDLPASEIPDHEPNARFVTSTAASLRDLWRNRGEQYGHRVIMQGCVDAFRSCGGRWPQRRPRLVAGVVR
jgi:hypothetical protein